MPDTLKRAKSNRFWAPNLIFELDISNNAKLVYLFLCRRAKSDGTSFPSRQNIAQNCSIAIRTIDKVLKELVSVGMLEKEHQFNEKNPDEFTSNLYTVHEEPYTNNCLGSANIAPPPVQQLRSKDFKSFKEVSFKEGGASPPIPPPQEKNTYGEIFNSVKLHQWEYDGLLKLFGEDVVKDYINRLDAHIASTGKKYPSHYATVYKWVTEDQRKKIKPEASTNRFANFSQRDKDYSKYEKLENLIRCGDTAGADALRRELNLV